MKSTARLYIYCYMLQIVETLVPVILTDVGIRYRIKPYLIFIIRFKLNTSESIV